MKKRKPTKAEASKPKSWEDMEKAQLAVADRICAELGIDRAELFRRARERIKRLQNRLREGA